MENIVFTWRLTISLNFLCLTILPKTSAGIAAQTCTALPASVQSQIRNTLYSNCGSASPTSCCSSITNDWNNYLSCMCAGDQWAPGISAFVNANQIATTCCPATSATTVSASPNTSAASSLGTSTTTAGGGTTTNTSESSAEAVVATILGPSSPQQTTSTSTTSNTSTGGTSSEATTATGG